MASERLGLQRKSCRLVSGEKAPSEYLCSVLVTSPSGSLGL